MGDTLNNTELKVLVPHLLSNRACRLFSALESGSQCSSKRICCTLPCNSFSVIDLLQYNNNHYSIEKRT